MPLQHLLKALTTDPCPAAEVLLRAWVSALRPAKGIAPEAQAAQFDARLEALDATFQECPELLARLRACLVPWLQTQGLLLPLSRIGILPRASFPQELWRRLYDSLNPEPAKTRDLGDHLRRVFRHRLDVEWVQAVSDASWMRAFAQLVPPNETRLLSRWEQDLLEALERLAIWVAAEELEPELIRLEPEALERESAFFALQHEVGEFTRAARRAGEEGRPRLDDAHLRVLLQQCHDALKQARKRSLSRGTSIRLTYLLERIRQTLERIEQILDVLMSSGHGDQAAAVGMFRGMVGASAEQDSARALWRQNIGLLARKVSDNASHHGEHYVASDRRGYLRMLASAAGAGLIVPFMAIVKIRIEAMGLAPLQQALLSSLNYGLGFVLIHILGFTIATKQPAMTAAYISNIIEHGQRSRARAITLVELLAQVCRSQFAAIVGNVAVALVVSMLVAAYFRSAGAPLLGPRYAGYVLNSLHPLAGWALLHAAIAGVWLFLAGLIAGYFDNRFQRLHMQARLHQHPVLQRLLPNGVRTALVQYLQSHYGSLWGNFLFGFLLGMTGLVGLLTGWPIDIRHVTFSAANLGFTHGLHWSVFLIYLGMVLLVGLVNLAMSFSLALWVGLRSRGLRISDPKSLLSALWNRLSLSPLEFLLPPATRPTQNERE